MSHLYGSYQVPIASGPPVDVENPGHPYRFGLDRALLEQFRKVLADLQDPDGFKTIQSIEIVNRGSRDDFVMTRVTFEFAALAAKP